MKILFVDYNFLYLIDADGNNKRLITEFGGAYMDAHAFLPDGSIIYIDSQEEWLITDTTLTLRNSFRYDINYLNGDYSPDSLWYTFSSGGIYIMNSDGSEKQFLDYGHDPQFSNDGLKIIYAKRTGFLKMTKY